MTIGGSKIDGIFDDEAELILQTIPNGRRVELITGERYYTSAFNDTGEALTLAGGNYANLIESGGGGGLPVNAMLEINSSEDLYIATDSTEWLKSGVIETDVASYPDANISTTTVNATYSGVTFPTGIQPQDITWDGVYYWVVNNQSNIVTQYTPTGIPTGFTFTVLIDCSGICWDGGHLWVVGFSDTDAYKYSTDGTYTGVSFPVTASSRAIAWIDNHFWVLSNISASQYTPSGIVTGKTIAVGKEDGGMLGICSDGHNIWVIGSSSADKAYQYNAAGVHTGRTFSVAAEESSPSGMCWNGEAFVVVGSVTGAALEYTPESYTYVGAIEEVFSVAMVYGEINNNIIPSTQKYVRIK